MMGETPIDPINRTNTNLSGGVNSNVIANGQPVRSKLRYAKLSERIFSSKREAELNINQLSKIKGVQAHMPYPDVISRNDQGSEQHFMPTSPDEKRSKGGILQKSFSGTKDRPNRASSGRKIQIDSELREKLKTDRIQDPTRKASNDHNKVFMIGNQQRIDSVQRIHGEVDDAGSTGSHLAIPKLNFHSNQPTKPSERIQKYDQSVKIDQLLLDHNHQSLKRNSVGLNSERKMQTLNSDHIKIYGDA